MIAFIASSFEIGPVSQSVRESQLDLFGLHGDEPYGRGKDGGKKN